MELKFFKRSQKWLYALLIACICLGSTANAQTPKFQQDTLHLKLDSAEHIFIRQNLSLLAQKYNIDANDALVIQARLYPNPNFGYSRGPIIPLKNPTATFFNNSENQFDISQTILLAGKRNKSIKLAQANVTLAKYQFYDLIRTLKYTLRSDFFNIYYLMQSASVYEREIKALQQIVNAFNQLQGKGYIAQTEVVRIKAQLYAFQSEYNDLLNQINDTESELRQVLQVKYAFIDPVVDTAKVMALSPTKYGLATLVDSAHNARTDLLIAKANTDIGVQNYNYQKALAVPDVTLSFAYDQQGSYVNQFQSIGASIDLPFFNRNQGNIKSAKANISMYEATQQSTAFTVEEQIIRGLQKAFDAEKLIHQIDPTFEKDFDRLTNEVTKNYQKRNISILDFLDFYDAYKQNAVQINSIRYNRVQTYEDLNFYTGTNFFN
jgi:cobalt-zinc-cadmium efflux system outer membrane protein